MPEVNYFAILLCGLVSMVLGALWYGPVFGKKWMALMKLSPEQITHMTADKRGMMRSYAITFVGWLVTAYVFSHILTFAMSYMNTSGVSAGLSGAFWIWLGFIAPLMLGKVLWEGKSWKLWFLDSSYFLIVLATFGVILSSMM